MNLFRTLTLSAIALPLALTLSACGGDKDGGSASLEAGKPLPTVEAPAGKKWADVAEVTPEGGWRIGNPDAPLKLVEYASMTCPACATFSMQAAEPLKKEYVDSGRVSYEFRSMLIHGTPDLVLTRLATCGSVEAVHPLAEQVWSHVNELLDPMQANAAALEQAMSLPEAERLPAFAEKSGFADFFAQRGVSHDQAKACLSDLPAMRKLAEDLDAQATKDNINHTPTFFLNGKLLEEGNWAQLEPVLQRAGAR